MRSHAIVRSPRFGSAILTLLAAAAASLFDPTARGQALIDLGVLQADHHSSQGLAVNSDGTVVVGDSASDFFQDSKGIRWTRAGGMQDVGALPGSFNTFAQGVNADGTAIAGSCYTADRDHAFRWTANGGMEDLGTLPDAP